VVGEAVDTAFGELLAALLARVLISVGGIFELGSAVKVLKDYGVGLATHGQLQAANISLSLSIKYLAVYLARSGQPRQARSSLIYSDLGPLNVWQRKRLAVKAVDRPADRLCLAFFLAKFSPSLERPGDTPLDVYSETRPKAFYLPC
jgi:hypothetical protein